MASPDSIAIVGGGIGGLCLAVGCLQRNVSIHVYEAAHKFAEIGAGVSFGPNSLRAMEMISPQVWQGFSRLATNNAEYPDQKYWFRFRTGQGSASKTGDPICNVDNHMGQNSVHRARYLDELVSQIPDGTASFGKRLKDIEDKGDHVILHFEDHTSAKHAAVICCDGIKSKGRQMLLGQNHEAAHAVFSGKYAYRGLIPMDQAADLLGADIAGNSHMFTGNGGHVLIFPIENGKTMNVVAFHSAEKWDDPEWVKPMSKDDMRRDFADWVEVVHGIISLMQKPDTWALFEMPPAPTYAKNRLCLLGDAAHASTPHQGAGAGMAIEDALVMATLLESLDPSHFHTAFKVFDAVRRDRTQRLVSTSHEAGMLYEYQLPGVEDDLELIKQNLDERYKWIWDFDMKRQLQEAMAVLRTEVSTDVQ